MRIGGLGVRDSYVILIQAFAAGAAGLPRAALFTVLLYSKEGQNGEKTIGRQDFWHKLSDPKIEIVNQR